MPKYVNITARLSVDELASRYRKAIDPIERSRFQIVWLLAQGKRVSEVAGATGYCANWIRILARRYNQNGPQALADQRHYNRGASPLLSQELQGNLQQVLDQTASDGGLWTGPKVASWMGERTGRTVHPQRGWDYLKRLGFSLHIPRPSHYKADRNKQEVFKQALPGQVKQIQQAHPQAQVELWCMDEHRIGLKPVLRRVWARRGQRPIVRVQHRYQWLYVYGFACPESGATHWLLLPTVNIEIFTIALAHFAQAIGAGPQKHVILVLDQSGWHPSRVSPTLFAGVAASRTALAAYERSHRQSTFPDA